MIRAFDPQAEYRILLLGAGGQMGQEIQRLARTGFLPPEFSLVPLDRSQLDLVDLIRGEIAVPVRGLLDAAHLIINCAAYTAVDRAELEPELASAINEQAVRSLAQWAADRGQVLLHLSTDFVFGGDLTRPYSEADDPAPLNHYGRSKLAGERAIEQILARRVIIRSSWLFGSYGHNFAVTIGRKLIAGTPLKIVADQLGSPTPAGELARAILTISRKIAAGDACFGLWHFAGVPAASWYQLAVAIAESMLQSGVIGRVPSIEPIGTGDWVAAALRPRNSVLDCRKIALELGLAPPRLAQAQARPVRLV